VVSHRVTSEPNLVLPSGERWFAAPRQNYTEGKSRPIMPKLY
jgi:hypothetical protein